MVKTLSPSIQEFISLHQHDDVNALLLKHKSVEGVSTKFVINQIEGRRKAQIKFPSWGNRSDLLYPPSENLQQSSSEATAKYKASLVTEGKRGADLTGGFGVDTLYLSQKFKVFFYIEPNEELAEIVEHNASTLSRNNIVFKTIPAENFFEIIQEFFDFIYLDPSRRTQRNKKLVHLENCLPDPLALQSPIFEKSRFCLIKTSPLLDIHQALTQLDNVKSIHVVSVGNECRELLFFQEKDFRGDPEIFCVNLDKWGNHKNAIFRFFLRDEALDCDYGDPKKYFYEPNASILKAGAFKSIARKFSLCKIHPNTHLYTSDKIFKSFPGKIFLKEVLISSKPRTPLEEIFPGSVANFLLRNYPGTTESLKKRFRLGEGGEKYALAFSAGSRAMVFSATRIQ